ncbi:hypothetical protein BKA62DRAFT_723334 [Auriculariales sp. MPI-PUGE-AT-0066]|nr:hypothetical protein BKA62DRAFT_723334 [Auriculariales sp. MPI-PUGE-AT-0066]
MPQALRSRSLIDVFTGSRFMLWSQRHRKVRLWYSTFSCPQVPLSAATPAPPPLTDFIAYRARLPSCVAFTTLYLLARLKAWFPAVRGSSGHRLFTAVLLNTSKIVCYDTCSNKPWHVVGQGMFSLKEI